MRHIPAIVPFPLEGSKGHIPFMRSSIAESFAPSELKNKQINCFSVQIKAPALLIKL